MQFFAPAAPAPGDEEWTCGTCTYQNVRSARRCAVCGQAHRKQKKVTAVGLTGAPAAAGDMEAYAEGVASDGTMPSLSFSLSPRPSGVPSSGVAGALCPQPPTRQASALIPLEEYVISSSSGSDDEDDDRVRGVQELKPRMHLRRNASASAVRAGAKDDGTGDRRRGRKHKRYVILAHVRPIPRGAVAPSLAAEMERLRKSKQQPSLYGSLLDKYGGSHAGAMGNGIGAGLGAAVTSIGGTRGGLAAEANGATGRTASPPLARKRSLAAMADAIRHGKGAAKAAGGSGGVDAGVTASGGGGGRGRSKAWEKQQGLASLAFAGGAGNGKAGGSAKASPLATQRRGAAADGSGEVGLAGQSRKLAWPLALEDEREQSSPLPSAEPLTRKDDVLDPGSLPRAVVLSSFTSGLQGVRGDSVGLASVEIRAFADGAANVSWTYPPGNPGDCNAWIALVPEHRATDPSARTRFKMLTRNRVCGEVRFAPHELSKVANGKYRFALHAPTLGKMPALSAVFEIADGAPVGFGSADVAGGGLAPGCESELGAEDAATEKDAMDVSGDGSEDGDDSVDDVEGDDGNAVGDSDAEPEPGFDIQHRPWQDAVPDATMQARWVEVTPCAVVAEAAGTASGADARDTAVKREQSAEPAARGGERKSSYVFRLLNVLIPEGALATACARVLRAISSKPQPSTLVRARASVL